MLTENSVFRRIPACLDPKQAFFIDGIRHSVELFDFAYFRLRDLLTDIALNPPTEGNLPQLSTAAFLDAWAAVDAIDRFRCLYQQFPGMERVTDPTLASLSEVCEPFRKVRNIGDHLSTAADQVLSKKGAALGVLSWCTGYNVVPLRIWFCTIRPGTIREEPQFQMDRVETTLDWPTDRVCLVAAGHEANLSSIRPHIELRIRHLEEQISEQLKLRNMEKFPTASDLLIRRSFELAPGQIPLQHK